LEALLGSEMPKRAGLATAKRSSPVRNHHIIIKLFANGRIYLHNSNSDRVLNSQKFLLKKVRKMTGTANIATDAPAELDEETDGFDLAVLAANGLSVNCFQSYRYIFIFNIEIPSVICRYFLRVTC
jgi:hypothetical protein